ncbi:MAG TPA: ATP-binding protein [Fimbriimonadaceae bacterium]|nr:ATP-binding protein [Fimbriimonadaceae bacterium]
MARAKRRESVHPESEHLRKQARLQEQLRVKTAFLEAVVNSSINGLLLSDCQGNRIIQNKRLNDLWHIPPTLAEGPDDSSQLQLILSQVTDPAGFLEAVRHLHANPQQTYQQEVHLQNGDVFDLYSSPMVAPEGDLFGRIWIYRDITWTKQGEAALRESEEKLRILAESIPQLVFVCRIDGWNTYFNQQWVDYTGMSLEESHGHGWNLAFHPDDQGHGSHANSEHGAYELECRIRRADGAYRWFLVRGQPLLDADGKITEWFGTCTDIHDLKVAEEALREAQNELEERVAQRTKDLTVAIEEAQRANQAKSEFLSRISHELRTPLNAILGFGQVLAMDRPADSPDREPIQLILKGGRHLLALINEVLDIASAEAGRLGLSIEPIALADLVAEACSLMLPLAAQSQVEIVNSVDEEDRLYALADNQRFKQVLLNLLSNGIKYNRQGGSLTISCVKSAEGRVRIAVRDTGMGFSPEEIDKLFIPFERLHATNSSIEGSGLGLALSQRLMTAMQGSLTVDSVPSLGSTFICELPEASPPIESLPPENSDAYPSPAVSGAFKVLCIEDNLSNLRLIEIILASRPGIQLLSAMQGSLGMELARQQQPNVILLDLNLPDIPGAELLKSLRLDAKTSHIPVVVVSADATPTQVARLLAAGAKAYLTKPIEVSQFLTTLDEALMDSRKAA